MRSRPAADLRSRTARWSKRCSIRVLAVDTDCTRLFEQGSRSAARDFPEDGWHAHRAHLRQARRVDPRRGRPPRHAARAPPRRTVLHGHGENLTSGGTGPPLELQRCRRSRTMGDPALWSRNAEEQRSQVGRVPPSRRVDMARPRGLLAPAANRQRAVTLDGQSPRQHGRRAPEDPSGRHRGLHRPVPPLQLRQHRRPIPVARALAGPRHDAPGVAEVPRRCRRS